MQTKFWCVGLLGLIACTPHLKVSPDTIQVNVGQAALVKVTDEKANAKLGASSDVSPIAKAEATTTPRTFIVYGLSPGTTMVRIGAEGYIPAEISVTVNNVD